VTTGLAPGDNADQFVFQNILPGKYQVTISYPGDSWCWKQQKFDVEVKSSDLTDLEFIQEGYKMNIKASHAVDISYAASGAVAKKTAVKVGDNTFCLDKAGTHYVLTCSL